MVSVCILMILVATTITGKAYPKPKKEMNSTSPEAISMLKLHPNLKYRGKRGAEEIHLRTQLSRRTDLVEGYIGPDIKGPGREEVMKHLSHLNRLYRRVKPGHKPKAESYVVNLPDYVEQDAKEEEIQECLPCPPRGPTRNCTINKKRFMMSDIVIKNISKCVQPSTETPAGTAQQDVLVSATTQQNVVPDTTQKEVKKDIETTTQSNFHVVQVVITEIYSRMNKEKNDFENITSTTSIYDLLKMESIEEHADSVEVVTNVASRHQHTQDNDSSNLDGIKRNDNISTESKDVHDTQLNIESKDVVSSENNYDLFKTKETEEGIAKVIPEQTDENVNNSDINLNNYKVKRNGDIKDVANTKWYIRTSQNELNRAKDLNDADVKVISIPAKRSESIEQFVLNVETDKNSN